MCLLQELTYNKSQDSERRYQVPCPRHIQSTLRIQATATATALELNYYFTFFQ